MRTADPAVGDSQDARLRLGGVDHVLHRLVGRFRVDHQHQRPAFDQAYRQHILLRIEWHVLEHRRIDRERREIAHADGVPIGRSLGNHIGADIAAGARLVFHDHRTAKNGGQLLRHLAPANIAIPPGRIGHDEGDVLRRIVLRVRAASRNKHRRQQRRHPRTGI